MTTTGQFNQYPTDAQLIAMGKGSFVSDAFSTRYHAGEGLIIEAHEAHKIGEMWAEDAKGIYVSVGGKWHHRVSGSGLPARREAVPEPLASRLEAATLRVIELRNAYRAKLEGAQS